MKEQNMPWLIPDSWSWSTMGEISVIIGGGTPSTKDAKNFENGDIPWLTPADLSGYTEKYVSHGKRNITKVGLQSSSARIMPKGTVLYTSRAPIGYVAIASNEISTNQGFKSFVLYNGIDPEFVYYYLQRAHNIAIGLSSGTTFREISGRKAATIPIALATLPEQHRIVEAIESYFTRLDDVIATLERVQQNLKRYRASVLKAAVEGRLVPTEAELARKEGRDYEPADVLLKRILVERKKKWVEEEAKKELEKAEAQALKKGISWNNEDRARALEAEKTKAEKKYKEPAPPDTSNLPELSEGWCWATVERIASHIVDCPHSTPKWTNEGEICVRTTEFEPGYLNLKKTRFVSKKTYEERINRLKPKPGDILFSREGGILGIACEIPPGVDICMGQRMMLIRISESLSGRYYMHFLNSPITQYRIKKLIGGSASPHVNVGDVQSFPVTLPPAHEVKRIVDVLEEKLSLIKETELHTKKILLRYHRLRQSILKWAFEGKLVDQDPNDEPAAVLLDRIKAEREVLDSKNNTGKHRKKNTQ